MLMLFVQNAVHLAIQTIKFLCRQILKALPAYAGLQAEPINHGPMPGVKSIFTHQQQHGSALALHPLPSFRQFYLDQVVQLHTECFILRLAQVSQMYGSAETNAIHQRLLQLLTVAIIGEGIEQSIEFMKVTHGATLRK